MKNPPTAVARSGRFPQRPGSLRSSNTIHFPHALRDAIPGPELPGCDRCLILSSIDASRFESFDGVERVQLKLQAQESGKLTGAFDVKVHLNLDAARALAATLQQVIERQEVR